MSKERRISVASIVVLILIIVFQYWQTQPLYVTIKTLEKDKMTLAEEIKTLEEDFPHLITEIMGPLREKYLEKKVTIQGYLAVIGDNTPILVQDLDLLLINMPIPEDLYIPLIGLNPEEAFEHFGALVHIKGRLTEEFEKPVFDLDPDFEKLIVVKPSKDWVLRMAYWALTIEAKIEASAIFSPNYSVLISGGGNAAHSRYWNDLKKMYSILVNDYNYNPSRIIVIYKDGIAEDNDIPVDYSATLANVTAAFTSISNKITSNQDLFIFTTNHGSGFHPTDPYNIFLFGDIDTDGDEPETGYSEATYNRDFNIDGDTNDIIQVDEVLNLYQNERLVDDDLADMLDEITCRQMIIVMEQCFSGGFIHELSASNRVVMTACLEEEFSWSCDTEGDYDEFVYHFMLGIEEPDLDGDDNDDGRVSISEAFNYAAQNDSTSETPMYDDNGDNLGHPEPLPNGGDGSNGDSVYI